MMAATAKLRAEAKGGTLTAILLDVRSNPGGLVDEATEIADEFLSSGGIYSMRHRGEVIEDLKARSGGAFADIPCVALVNEWSASASELLVGALQDNKRATVVGANTFGKGSVQSILPLPSGAGLKLTTARYYTPSGHAIQADGIHPDVVIESGTNGPQEAPKVTRERDLPGHLAAEGPQGGAGQRDAGAIVLDGGTRRRGERHARARRAGRPVVVERRGPPRRLPDAEGQVGDAHDVREVKAALGTANLRRAARSPRARAASAART